MAKPGASRAVPRRGRENFANYIARNRNQERQTVAQRIGAGRITGTAAERNAFGGEALRPLRRPGVANRPAPARRR